MKIIGNNIEDLVYMFGTNVCYCDNESLVLIIWKLLDDKGKKTDENDDIVYISFKDIEKYDVTFNEELKTHVFNIYLINGKKYVVAIKYCEKINSIFHFIMLNIKNYYKFNQISKNIEQISFDLCDIISDDFLYLDLIYLDNENYDEYVQIFYKDDKKVKNVIIDLNIDIQAFNNYISSL